MPNDIYDICDLSPNVNFLIKLPHKGSHLLKPLPSPLYQKEIYAPEHAYQETIPAKDGS
jgi:hypothetical protein